MIYMTPFHPDHLLRIRFVEPQSFLDEAMANPEWRRSFFAPAMSVTFVDRGDILACAGIRPIWPGRGCIWAMFDREVGPRRFLEISLKGRRLVDGILQGGFYRIEAHVVEGFEQGRRWAEIMGFTLEGERLRKLDGERDYNLYAKVA